MTTSTTIRLALVFCLSICIQGLINAQTLGISPASDINKTNKTKTLTKGEKVANAKKQALVNAPLGNPQIKNAASTKTSARGTVKTVYGYLYQDREGTVILDSGKGETPVMKADTRTAYKSIIAALNYLSSDRTWRVMHNYDITASNPRPSFLLIKQVREE